MTTAATLLMRARDRRLLLATAESCTAGLISAAITDEPGSSDIFDRGFVTYSNAAKTEMLGVRQATLDTHGAVSEPVAREMADGALARSQADIAVAVTGIAGPGGGTEAKPEGRVCFALARQGAETVAETLDFGPLGRGNVRAATVDHALTLLLRAAESA
jgi:competence/damage-inducible protein CinA C-terminal domain